MAAEHSRGYSPWAARSIFIVAGLTFVVLAFFLPGLVRLLVVGALVAYLLDPAVQYFERRDFSRTTATVSVFALLTILAFLLLISLVPAAVRQLEGLRSLDVTPATAYLENLDQDLDAWMERFGMGEVNLVASIGTYLTEHVPDVLGVLPDALSFLAYLVLLPFIVFFMLKDGRGFKKGSLSVIPNRYFEFSLGLLYKMDRQLGNYLRGQLMEAAIVGLLSVLALWILGVPYFLPIGLFAGIANIVPYLGPLAGSIVAVVISFLTGGTLGDAVLILTLFSLIQALDNTIVQPLVVARNVRMHPLTVVVSVVAAGQLYGFLGLLLAVPVVAICKVFVVESLEYLNRYRVLGG